MRTRIKICGVKDGQIARAAAEAGADAIGMMFYEKSKRHITLGQAQSIVSAVPPMVNKIGVVVNPTNEHVELLLENLALDYLQFHGDESPEFCASFGLPYIKAIRVADGCNVNRIEEQFNTASAILLDTFVSNEYGGTGKAFDWRIARYNGTKPIILAGGLDIDNIGEAINTALPYAVDISSGVETNGQKDVQKINHFCSKVAQLSSYSKD